MSDDNAAELIECDIPEIQNNLDSGYDGWQNPSTRAESAISDVKTLMEIYRFQAGKIEQLKAEIEKLYGWLRNKEATIGSWSSRAEAAEAMLERAKAAPPATCSPTGIRPTMTGAELYEKLREFGDGCGDQWDRFAAWCFPPDRRAVLDSQIVVTRHGEHLAVLELIDIRAYVFHRRYDARWEWREQDKCGRVYDSRESAERAARDWLVDQALKQESDHA